jgi:hypothetical protein
MGDAFDGWGYSTSGGIIWIVYGLPLSALVFLGWAIHLFLQSRSEFDYIRHHRLRTRWFLLRSSGGIIAGSFAGCLLTLLLIGQIDDCNLYKAQINRASYPAETKANARQQSQAINCPEVLKSENPHILNPIVWLIAVASAPIGLICGLKLFRKS